MSTRVTKWLWVVVLFGWALRALPLLRFGPLAIPSQYDDGVYFSAACKLLRGELPYRDFVLVHPPGLLFFLAPFATLAQLTGPRTAFALARWLYTFIGAANTYLVGRVAMRVTAYEEESSPRALKQRTPPGFTTVATLIAALAYATYGEAISAERTILLEPVLNLVVLTLFLTAKEDRALRAGLLGGFALSVKIWAGLWWLAGLATLSKERVRYLIGTAVALAIFVAPFVLVAPNDFVRDVLLFHTQRPPDGIIGVGERLPVLFAAPHLLAVVFGIIGLGVALKRGPRAIAAVYLATAVAFLTARTYWNQYNGHFAAAESVLAGVGAAALPVRRWVYLPLVVVLLIAPAKKYGRSAALSPIQISPRLTALPKEGSLFAFEPAWALLADRVPPSVVDPYATQLMAGPKNPLTLNEALLAPTAQAWLRPFLAQQDAVLLGGRGRGALGPDGMAWFQSAFTQTEPLLIGPDVDLWIRRAP